MSAPPIFSCMYHPIPTLLVPIVPDVSCALIYSPGWVHTGMTGAKNGGDKPAGAWTAEQTVEYMVEKVFDEGDFYVICPDNDTSSVRSASRTTTRTDDKQRRGKGYAREKREVWE